MHIEPCTYHGEYISSYLHDSKTGTAYTIRQEQDLTELVEKTLITSKIKENLTSRIDLKERNIYLIYYLDFGGGANYYLKNIDLNSLNITFKIASFCCPGIGGTCDVKAFMYALSLPKSLQPAKVQVDFEKLDIFSEPEFQDFEQIPSIDKDIEKNFLSLDRNIRYEITNSLMYQMADETLEKAPWFTQLNDNQKNSTRQYRSAFSYMKQNFEALGPEKVAEKDKEIISRCRQLQQRLSYGPDIHMS